MSDDNLPCTIGTEDASVLRGSPVTSGPFYAYRLTLPQKGVSGAYKVTVVLFESYPVPGRIWTRAYNPDTGAWSDWLEHA